MKQVETALNNHLNTSKHFQSCDLYQIILKSGLTYYFTNSDIPVTYNGNVYRADGPIINRTQIQTHSNVAVDKLTVTIYCTEQDKMGGTPVMKVAHNGGFDGGTFNLRRAFFSEGKLLDVIDLFEGNMEIREGGGLKITIEVKSTVQKLNTEWPLRRYYPLCPYNLYCKECGVRVENYRKRATVTQVPAHNTVVLDGNLFTDGYYDAGGIEWLTGPLVGQSTQIIKYQHGNVIFMSAQEVQPRVGDVAYVYPGCDKTAKTCKDKFNNFNNNRSTPFVPRKESIR